MAEVRAVQKLLQEAKEAIVDINKEEAFYKRDPTSYPEAEVIRERIDLYQKLFGLVHTWQRTETRSDNSFTVILITKPPLITSLSW